MNKLFAFLLACFMNMLAFGLSFGACFLAYMAPWYVFIFVLILFLLAQAMTVVAGIEQVMEA